MGKLSYRQLEQYCGRDCGARQTEKKKKKAAPGPGGKLSYEALEEYCGRQAEPRAPSSSFVTPQPGTSLPRLGANGAARGSAAGAGSSAPPYPSAFVPVQPGTSLPRFGAGAAAQNGGTKVKTAAPSPFASARQSGGLPKLGGEWTGQNSGSRTAAAASPIASGREIGIAAAINATRQMAYRTLFVLRKRAIFLFKRVCLLCLRAAICIRPQF